MAKTILKKKNSAAGIMPLTSDNTVNYDKQNSMELAQNRAVLAHDRHTGQWSGINSPEKKPRLHRP